jgi:hypothetical protein
VENRLLRLNNNWLALRDQLADLIERRDLLQDLLTLMGSHPDRQQLKVILTERLERLLQLRLAGCSLDFESTFLGKNWPDFIAHLHNNGAEAGNRLPGTLPPAEVKQLEKWQEIASILTTAEGKPRKQVGPATGFYSGFSKSKWAEAILKLPAETLHHLQDLKTLPSVSAGTADLDALYDLVLVVGEALILFWWWAKRLISIAQRAANATCSTMLNLNRQHFDYSTRKPPPICSYFWTGKFSICWWMNFKIPAGANGFCFSISVVVGSRIPAAPFL